MKQGASRSEPVPTAYAHRDRFLHRIMSPSAAVLSVFDGASSATFLVAFKSRTRSSRAFPSGISDREEALSRFRQVNGQSPLLGRLLLPPGLHAERLAATRCRIAAAEET